MEISRNTTNYLREKHILAPTPLSVETVLQKLDELETRKTKQQIREMRKRKRELVIEYFARSTFKKRNPNFSKKWKVPRLITDTKNVGGLAGANREIWKKAQEQGLFKEEELIDRKKLKKRLNAKRIRLRNDIEKMRKRQRALKGAALIGGGYAIYEAVKNISFAALIASTPIGDNVQKVEKVTISVPAPGVSDTQTRTTRPETGGLNALMKKEEEEIPPPPKPPAPEPTPPAPVSPPPPEAPVEPEETLTPPPAPEREDEEDPRADEPDETPMKPQANLPDEEKIKTPPKPTEAPPESPSEPAKTTPPAAPTTQPPPKPTSPPEVPKPPQAQKKAEKTWSKGVEKRLEYSRTTNQLFITGMIGETAENEDGSRFVRITPDKLLSQEEVENAAELSTLKGRIFGFFMNGGEIHPIGINKDDYSLDIKAAGFEKEFNAFVEGKNFKGKFGAVYIDDNGNPVFLATGIKKAVAVEDVEKKQTMTIHHPGGELPDSSITISG